MLNHKKLRMLREACGWTPTQMLEALANEQHIHCSHTKLSNYELGRTKNCPAELLFALAKLYDVRPEDLLC